MTGKGTLDTRNLSSLTSKVKPRITGMYQTHMFRKSFFFTKRPKKNINRKAWMPFSSGFHFHFSSLRINIKGYSGTAGKISSLGTPGSDFSTKDADNDKCVCKCSQLTTGGKRTAPQQHASTYLNISHVSCSLKIQVLRTMSKNEYITI